ncbi:hypothetical protein CAXC1_260034 [Candidatus Xenohaliotis californiensis]|uniref:Uncharacterized protein n=1 Tax=Candidatus Xenohaliotis californiensis TaxID=84677 RepID=A0ABP0ESQ1_9RICK|nr:hypothetical protein CAXC1_260034 [Candidatus Xenohaliotis californiensis]
MLSDKIHTIYFTDVKSYPVRDTKTLDYKPIPETRSISFVKDCYTKLEGYSRSQDHNSCPLFKKDNAGNYPLLKFKDSSMQKSWHVAHFITPHAGSYASYDPLFMTRFSFNKYEKSDGKIVYRSSMKLDFGSAELLQDKQYGIFVSASKVSEKKVLNMHKSCRCGFSAKLSYCSAYNDKTPKYMLHTPSSALHTVNSVNYNHPPQLTRSKYRKQDRGAVGSCCNIDYVNPNDIGSTYASQSDKTPRYMLHTSSSRLHTVNSVNYNHPL